jgi:hypothetical protein
MVMVLAPVLLGKSGLAWLRRRLVGRGAPPLSGGLWRLVAADGTGLVLHGDDAGRAYVGLDVPGRDGQRALSMRPVAELRRAELVIGGVARQVILRTDVGLAERDDGWPVPPDGLASAMAPGPIAVRVYLGASDDGVDVVVSAGPAAWQGEEMRAAFNGFTRLTRVLTGTDFLAADTDATLLGMRLDLEQARVRLDEVRRQATAYPGQG